MPGPDWAYWSLAIALGLTAAAGLYWALIADWRAGWGKPSRRRCQRCWYDMKGVPTTICPECGAAPKDERVLSRSKRHWWWAAASVLALAGAIAAAIGPFCRRDNPWDCVPTRTLLLLESVIGINRWPALTEERSKRIFEPGIDDETAVRLILRDKELLRFRERWPRSLPMVVRHGSEWADLLPVTGEESVFGDPVPGIAPLVRVARDDADWTREDSRQRSSGMPIWPPERIAKRFSDSPSIVVEFSSLVAPLVFRSVRVPLEVRFVNTIDELITPERGPATDEKVRAFLKPLVGRSFIEIARGPREATSGVTIALRFEILHNDEIVAAGRSWFPATNRAWYTTWRFELDKPLPTEANFDPSWRLRIRSDGELALRDFDSTRYWKGELEWPLSEIVEGFGQAIPETESPELHGPDAITK